MKGTKKKKRKEPITRHVSTKKKKKERKEKKDSNENTAKEYRLNSVRNTFESLLPLRPDRQTDSQWTIDREIQVPLEAT